MITYQGTVDLAAKRLTLDVKAPDEALAALPLSPRIREGKVRVVLTVPVLGDVEVDVEIVVDANG